MKTRTSACATYEGLIADRIAGTLSAADESRLHGHLLSCKQCAAAVAAYDSVLATVKSVERPDPGALFFDEYFDRLQERIDPKPSRAAVRERVSVEARIGLALIRWGLHPQSIKRFALAVTLIGIGVLVGRIAFPEVVTVPAIVDNPSQLARAELSEARAFEYLGRTKTLLIGLVNFDSLTESPELLNLPRRQEIANELLVQATHLKSELSDTEQHRLEGLIEDLELILTQIANIEATSDAPAIEILRGGVDRTGLLFRINVEEMRRGSSANREPPMTPLSGQSLAL